MEQLSLINDEDYTVGCVTFPKTREGYINFLKAQRDY